MLEMFSTQIDDNEKMQLQLFYNTGPCCILVFRFTMLWILGFLIDGLEQSHAYIWTNNLASNSPDLTTLNIYLY